MFWEIMDYSFYDFIYDKILLPSRLTFQNPVFREPDLSLDQTDNNYTAWKSTTADLDSDDISIITDNIKLFYRVECYCRGNRCSDMFKRVYMTLPCREGTCT